MPSVLYGARSDIAGDLYTIDPATGAETSVGPIGYAVAALAPSDDGLSLYGITPVDDPTTGECSLISIDKATGAGTLIGATGLNPGFSRPGPFDAELSSGELFVLSKGGTVGDGLVHLLQVDRITGAASEVNQLPINDEGMGFSNDGPAEWWRASYPQAFAITYTLDLLSADGLTDTPQGPFDDFPTDPDLFSVFLAFARDPDDLTTIYALVNTDLDFTDGSDGPYTAELISIDVTDPTTPTTSIKGSVLTGIRALCWDAPTTGGGGTPPTAPDPPTLAALTPGVTTMGLSWTFGADGGSPVTAVSILRGTTPGGETLLTTLGAVTSFEDTGLDPATTYYYEVVATNLIGDSDPSNEEFAETLVGLTWTNIGPQLIVLVAAGLNPDTFTEAKRYGLGERRGHWNPLALDQTLETQALSVRITQTGASATTEIYASEVAVRPLPDGFEGTDG